SSGPWHWKQVSERIGRMSRWKLIGDSAGARSADVTRKKNANTTAPLVILHFIRSVRAGLMAGPTLTPSSSENERAPIILSGPPFLLAILRVPTRCQSQLGRER